MKVVSSLTKLSYALAALPMTMGLLSSCADQDFDWESARMQNVEYAYRKTFEKAFGEIKPDQSWDFSSSAVAETRSDTRALGQSVVGGPNGEDYYYVNKNLLNWINTHMPEKGNSLSQLSGENVVFTVPNGPFTIYPVFQGLSLNWDLFMTVAKGGSNVETELVWKKSQNIQRQDADGWKNLGLDGGAVGQNFKDALEWYGGADISKSHFGYDYVYGSSGNANEIGYLTTTLRGENSTEGAPVRTKGYRYDLRQYAGQPMSFYLEILSRSKYHRNVTLGTKISSLSNQMRFIDLKANGLTLPEFGNKDVFVIGIEDSDYRWSGGQIVDSHGIPAKDKNGNVFAVADYDKDQYEKVRTSDFDYNDLVLIIVADKLEVKKQEYDTEVVTKKRYMVEDLGTTDDIDFNDMVVDIEDVKKYHHVIVTENGEIKSDTSTPKGHTQTAHVRALGGTLDFDFYIGDKLVYSKSQHKAWAEMINTGWKNTSINYNAELTSNSASINLGTYGNPWDPSTNNIKFVVYRDKKPRTEGGTTWEYENWVNTCSYAHTSNITYTEDEKKVLIGFPTPGQTPYIIAVDTDKQWRNERRPICAHWLANKNFSTTADCEICKGKEHGQTSADKPTSENGVVNGSTNNDPGFSYFASTTTPYKGGIVKITYSALSNGAVTLESSNNNDVSKLTGNGPTDGVFYVRANTVGETTVKLKIAATDTYRGEERTFKIVTQSVPTPDTTGGTVLSNQVTEELGAPFNVANQSYSQARYSDIFNGKDVKVGDVLRFYIVPTSANWATDVRKNRQNWDDCTIYSQFNSGNSKKDASGYDYFELTVTQDMVNDGGDFMLNGTGFICTAVTMAAQSPYLWANANKNNLYLGGLTVISYGSNNSNEEASFEYNNVEKAFEDKANKKIAVRATGTGAASVTVKQAASNGYSADAKTVELTVNALPTVNINSPAEVSVWNDDNNKKQFGNPLLSSNSYTQYTYDLKSALINNGAYTNCKLRFYITPNENSWAVQIRKSDWNTKYTETSSLTNSYIELNLDQTMINDGKFTFNAIGMTCTQVTLVKEEIDLKNYTAYFKLVNKQNPDYRTINYNYKPTWGDGDYGQVLVKSTDGIRNMGLTTKSKLVFYKTRTSTGQIKLNNQDSNNWSESYGGASDYSGNSDYIVINFNQDLINRINSNAYYAFVIQGDGLEITKISIIK